MDDFLDPLSDDAILAVLHDVNAPTAVRQEALRTAYTRHSHRLMVNVRTILGDDDRRDPHNAILALDETFKALWNRPPDGGRSSLFTWLFTVARRKSLDLVEDIRRRKKIESRNLQDKISENGMTLEETGELTLIAAGLENPWDDLVHEEYLEMVAKCVEDLPPAQKMVGAVILDAAKKSGEWPSNEDLLTEVKRRSGNANLTIEAVKSAKKQVRAKIRSGLK